jgi:hypothetical protein
MPWNAALFQPYCRRVDRGALAPALYLRQPRCGAIGDNPTAIEQFYREIGIHNCCPTRL